MDDGGAGTLRGIMAVADSNNEADTITFDPSVTFIKLVSGQISLTVDANPLLIDGPGVTIAGGPTATATNRIFRFFVALSDPTITLNGLTLTGGNVAAFNPGGAIETVNDMILNNVSIVDNKAGGVGGAIAISSSNAQVEINHSTIKGNSAGSTGGAINGTGPFQLTITNSVLADNIATSTGGAVHFAFGSPPTLTLISTVFSNNKSSDHGGALSIGNSSKVTISQCQFTGNQGNSGGAIRINGTAQVTIEQSSFTSNVASLEGGGVSVAQSSATLSVVASTFAKNSASFGGGISVSTFNAIAIAQCTFSANIAASGGGGAHLGAATVAINNSTFASNLASAATAMGGGISFSTSTKLTLNSTIIANNSAAGPGNDDLQSSFATAVVAGGNNLVRDKAPGNFTLSGSNLTGVDPLLGPLQNNGGPTETHALLPGSPALNAGSNSLGLYFDQRGAGFPRTLDGMADIGAFELTSAIPGVDGSAPNVPPSLATFAVTVTYADDVAIDTVGIDLNDIRVTGPAFPTAAIPASVVFSGSGQVVTATYTFDTPAGGWSWPHVGTYRIDLQPNQVFDTDGPNAVPARQLSSFNVVVALPELVVDNAGDVVDENYGPGQLTLREAIGLANFVTGTTDSIAFAPALSGSTITLGSELKISDPVQISGPGAANLTISGANAVRHFNIDVPGAGGTVNIAGLTLANGQSSSGGSILLNDEVLNLTGMHFALNKSSGSGGVINSPTAFKLTVMQSSFDGNSATSRGGTLAVVSQSTVTVDQSTFSNNSANTGGVVSSTGSKSSIALGHSTFSHNTATKQGGVIETDAIVTVNVNQSEFNNSSAGGGRRCLLFRAHHHPGH